MLMWFVVSMGFFDDIFIAHERLKDPSRLYPSFFTVTRSFVIIGFIREINCLCNRNEVHNQTQFYLTLTLISDETNQQWSWIYENMDDETQTEMRMEQGEQIR